MTDDPPEIHALNWALEALDTASTHLTLAVVFAESRALRTDARLLAEAIEAETAALCACLDRYHGLDEAADP